MGAIVVLAGEVVGVGRNRSSHGGSYLRSLTIDVFAVTLLPALPVECESLHQPNETIWTLQLLQCSRPCSD